MRKRHDTPITAPELDTMPALASDQRETQAAETATAYVLLRYDPEQGRFIRGWISRLAPADFVLGERGRVLELFRVDADTFKHAHSLACAHLLDDCYSWAFSYLSHEL